MQENKKKRKTGPKPDQLQIEGDWENAVKEALNKEKPKDGWPGKEKKTPKS